MESTTNSQRSRGFLFYLGEVKGDAFRWFGLTMRFISVPTMAQVEQITAAKPRSLKQIRMQFAGKMATIGVGKILSDMLKQDYDKMTRRFNRNKRKYIVPFDYTFYLTSFESRKEFDDELLEWLNTIHLACPLEFVIRDESDLGKHRYPGGEWSLVSEDFIAMHRESLPSAKALVENIPFRHEYSLNPKEQELLRFSLKFIDRVTGMQLFDNMPALARAIVSRSYLETLLHKGMVDDIVFLARENSNSSDDPCIYIDIGEIISESLKDPKPRRALKPEVIFNLIRQLDPLKHAWEIAFGDAYHLSLIARLAAVHFREDILALITTYIQRIDMWKETSIKWIGYKANEFLQKRKFEEALLLYKCVMPIDVNAAHVVKDDAIDVYHQSLWLLAKRNSGLVVDDETIDLFENRCLALADRCAAIYANAAFLAFERGSYRRALQYYESMFGVVPPTWPEKHVKLDGIVYVDVLQALIQANNNARVHRSKIDFFIQNCLPHAEQMPAIYSHAAYIFIQCGDFEQARDYYQLSKANDFANFPWLESQIDQHPFRAEFRKFLDT